MIGLALRNENPDSEEIFPPPEVYETFDANGNLDPVSNITTNPDLLKFFRKYIWTDATKN